MGEILPWMAERFDHRVCMYKTNLKQISKNDFDKNLLKKFNIPKLSLTEYLRKNIYVTTSGWFSDDALKYVIKKMGIDRVLFSIDYPYEKQKIASEWIDNVPLSLKYKKKIAYENAAKLLKIKI
jgi:2,3-dihydroxybenzoate decarboxylase